MPYLPVLDGIRAVAIVAVLVFHISANALTGGFTGVDVFFVLSGYLITSIILHDIREGDFSLKEFYLRRIQRLLPNAVVMVLFVVLVWSLLLPPTSAIQPAKHGIWALFNLSNIYIWRNLGGYWGGAAESAPLTHTWSLGVEEQFYLFYPFILLMLVRYVPRWITICLASGAILSFGACLYGSFTHPNATFYVLPTRIWELLIGAFIASRHKFSEKRGGRGGVAASELMRWLGLVGMALITLGYVIIDEKSVFPGFVALFPTIGTGLVLWAVPLATGWLPRVLGSGPMTMVGKLSYSIYLWHWPCIILGRNVAELWHFPLLAGSVCGGGLGIALGCAAYYFVEQPLRQRGDGRSRRLIIIGAGFFGTLACSIFVVTHRPVPDATGRFDQVKFSGLDYNAGKAAERSIFDSTRYYDVRFSELKDRTDDRWKKGGVVKPYGGGNPKVLVLGSSHALMYSRVIDDICRENGVSVSFLAADGGTPAFFEAVANANFRSDKEAREFDETRKRLIREWQPDLVFVIDRWDNQFGSAATFEPRLRAFLKEVEPSVRQIVFVSQIPVLAVGQDINLRAFTTWRPGKLMTLMPNEKESLRREAVTVAEAVAVRIPKLKILRPDRLFYMPDGSVKYSEARTFYYADDNHLSDGGSDIVRPMLQACIVDGVRSK